MKTVIEDNIKDFVDDVINRFNPERVILFGSHASGGATPDSDVDILVVMDFKSRPHQQAFEIRRTIKRTFPLDLLVRRPADIDRRLRLGDFFIKEIMQEGKVLYEKTRS
ncbi:MAG: nucleotidyltransferase domain-containing protein [Deltaproteobacteria bacterium]|jgi:predicted nucleotidyltransferase|nr:nucleotidyltransferase domain-containing protein [Deltaproteobacteria bacterium]